MVEGAQVMSKNYKPSHLARISLASVLANLFFLSMYVPKQIGAAAQNDNQNSRVSPVNPMNPREDAQPISPKGDTPEKTITHQKKTKKKVTESPPIAFISERHTITPIKPPDIIPVSYSGYLVRHLSGNFLYGTKMKSEEPIIFKEPKG